MLFYLILSNVRDDLRYRVDSASELVMVHGELLVVRGFRVDGVAISFMLLKLLKH